ncbi:MAG: Holliday junction branch migration protein RuvA [Verrucomicrobia bacterium]|jgi:holliday junction DNA helicase RuvA|nr:Holliday junction branch migration protein RuvA [Verrucomicrobiota bacterium]
MITFVRGSLVEKHPTRAVLDVGGVGYEVMIPLSSYDRLPSTGETCRILTVDHVREDVHQLFGFMTETERDMFGLLTGITGIGPKLALSALSGLSVRDIKAAVIEGDIKRISSISGVGKKMAERIVVELRHKISSGEAFEAIAGAADGGEVRAELRDAVLALVALGYKQDDAHKKVMQVTGAHPEAVDVESIIKFAISK